MSSLERNDLLGLYGSGRSMKEIAHLLDCSVHKVVYWMDKFGIKRRNMSEAVYVKLNPTGDPFKIKSKGELTREELFLFGLGIGIYMGEGTKVSLQSLRVANTDPVILRIFRKFLVDVCRLREERMSYSIVCFNDTDPELARGYWSKELGLPPDKFGKITQIPTQGKGNYKRKSQFGVCTFQANNVKLRNWVMGQIGELSKSFLPG